MKEKSALKQNKVIIHVRSREPLQNALFFWSLIHPFVCFGAKADYIFDMKSQDQGKQLLHLEQLYKSIQL